MSISSLSSELNEIIFVDILSLDELCLIHFMDLAGRFSTPSIVHYKSMRKSIDAFEQNLVTHTGTPRSSETTKLSWKDNLRNI